MPDQDGDRRKQIEKLAYAKWESAGCPTGRDREFWLAAEKEVEMPIIVVHGVGNQKRGVTLDTFMQTLGKVMSGGSGTEIIKRADVLVKSPPDPPRTLPDPPDPSPHRISDGNYYPHAVLQLTGNAAPWHFYEFYWADESRIGDTAWNKARSYWQILVGLPRLGLYALESPDAPKPRFIARALDGLVRFLYVAAWSTLVARFLVVLLMGFCRFSGYPEGREALYKYLAWADLIRTGTALAFLLALAVWWVVSPFCGGKECSAVLKTVQIALTAATMLTALVDLGIRYKPLEFFKPVLSFVRSGVILPPELYHPTKSFDPRLFYVFNTVTGVLWGSSFVIVLVWAMWTSARVAFPWLLRRLTGQGDTNGGSIERVIDRTRFCWGLLGFVLLLLHPLAFQYDWWSGFPKPDWWSFTYYHEKPVPRRIDTYANIVFEVFQLAVGLAIGPFALVSFVLVTSSSVREALVPGLELALDVLNYLPPRPFIDAWFLPRFLLGGRRAADQPALSHAFAARLRSLIELAGARSGTPVRVVAHSLGSIIALSALERWEDGLEVDLTTMGSPLMLLAERLPRAYGRARPDGGERVLTTVVRWRNFFFSQDLIGRGLGSEVWNSPGFKPKLALGKGTHTEYVADRRLGKGTHTEYFADRRFASDFLN